MILSVGCKKKDTTLPVIELIGDANVSSPLNATYTDQGASAMDDEDGDLRSVIEVDNPVNKDSAATYTVTYTVMDASGNESSVTRNVRIYNEAEAYAGSYTVADETPFGIGSTTNYTETISVSKSVNKRMWVTTFGNQVNGKAYFDVNLTTNSLSIPTQTVVCGSPAVSRTFGNPIGSSLSSSISTGSVTIINMYFSHVTLSTPNNVCKGIYTKL